MTNPAVFSGAYRRSDDVEFLLTPVTIAMTSVEEKEALIQSGKKHYSDMLSQEPAPTAFHLDLFEKASVTGAQRLASEVMMLAKALCKQYGDTPIVLASLVRAGVPLGVMLQRALKMMGKVSYHYGISIIRDRGIDEAALSVIERRHGTEGIVFVDGWTGKGAITNQLTASLADRAGYPAIPRLVVLADPCGCAWLSATDDDWLIPFGIMGAPVSGMISRSLYCAEGYHQCMVCDHLVEFECGAGGHRGEVLRVHCVRHTARAGYRDPIRPQRAGMGAKQADHRPTGRAIRCVQHQSDQTRYRRGDPCGAASCTRPCTGSLCV